MLDVRLDVTTKYIARINDIDTTMSVFRARLQKGRSHRRTTREGVIEHEIYLKY